jgi:hypothetical protein
MIVIFALLLLGTGQQAAVEKESRTPAQRKIDSALLYEIYRRRGEAAQKNVPPGETGVKIDPKGRALVDVRAAVSPAMQKKIVSLGSAIVSTSREYHSVIAWVPLLRLERLAADPAVRAIVPAAEASTVR